MDTTLEELTGETEEAARQLDAKKHYSPQGNKRNLWVG
jgi:hypothetical protein